MKIALTDVLPGGRPGATVVHLTDPYDGELTMCSQYVDGSVANFNVAADVDCMTCLVRANRPSIEDHMAAALQIPREFLYGKDKDALP